MLGRMSRPWFPTVPSHQRGVLEGGGLSSDTVAH